MNFNQQKPAKIVPVGLISLIIIVSLLGCTNSMQAQDQRPIRADKC